MDTLKYNGWTNRTTWAMHLHITNDEGIYRAALDAVGRKPEHEAEDALEALVREGVEVESNPWATLRGDLVGCALAQVDWSKIVRALQDR